MSGQRPKKTFRMGLVVASIFDQDTQTVPIYNVSITRLYKADKDDPDWQRSSTFGRDDLPLVMEVSRQAWTWIHEQLQTERAESRKAART